MGLNDIKLSSSTLVGLFHQSLVETVETQSEKTLAVPLDEAPKARIIATVVEEYAGIKSLGDNLKKILIIVNYHDAPFLPDDELEFLTRMLTACKLNLGDVAIVNIANQPGLAYKELLKRFQSKLVFLFGIDPIDFGLPASFPAYQVQSLAGTTFLYAQALEERHNDKLLRSKLWVSLQKIFSL